MTYAIWKEFYFTYWSKIWNKYRQTKNYRNDEIKNTKKTKQAYYKNKFELNKGNLKEIPSEHESGVCNVGHSICVEGFPDKSQIRQFNFQYKMVLLEICQRNRVF